MPVWKSEKLQLQSLSIYFSLVNYRWNIICWFKNTFRVSLAKVDRSCPSNLEAVETRLGSASIAVTSRPSPNDRKRVKWPYDNEINKWWSCQQCKSMTDSKLQIKNYTAVFTPSSLMSTTELDFFLNILFSWFVLFHLSNFTQTRVLLYWTSAQMWFGRMLINSTKAQMRVCYCIDTIVLFKKKSDILDTKWPNILFIFVLSMKTVHKEATLG